MLHHITCASLDISILILRFGDQAHTCRVDTPTSHQKRTRRPSTEVSWLFDKLSNNNASDNGLFLSVSIAVNRGISEVILIPGNDAIVVAYLINAHYNTYGHCCINKGLHFVKSIPINDFLKEAI